MKPLRAIKTNQPAAVGVPAETLDLIFFEAAGL